MASVVQVKARFGDDVRRFALTPETATFSFVDNKLRTLFYDSDVTARFYVRYEDDDSDFVTMTCDEELHEAIRQCLSKPVGAEQVLRIVTARLAAPPSAPPPPPSTAQQPSTAAVPPKQPDDAETSTSSFLPPFVTRLLSNPSALATLDSIAIAGPLFQALPNLLGQVLGGSEQLCAALNSESRLQEQLQLITDVLPRVPHIAAAFARDEVHSVLTVYAPQFAALLRDFLQSHVELWSAAAEQLASRTHAPFSPMTLLPLLPFVMGQGDGSNPMASLFGGDASGLAGLFAGPRAQPQQQQQQQQQQEPPQVNPLAALLGAFTGAAQQQGAQGNPLAALLGALGQRDPRFSGPHYQQPRRHHHHQQQQTPTTADQHTVATVVHEGVTCDVCGVSPISGSRFNCSVCYNFDLCSVCEAAGRHDSTHPLVKLQHAARKRHSDPSPEQPEPVRPHTVVPMAMDEDDSELENKLQQLAEMGFENRAENIELLRRNGGSVNRVVLSIVEFGS